MTAHQDFCRLVTDIGVAVSPRPAALGLPPAMPEIPRGHTAWLVTLDRDGTSMTVPWYQHRPGGAYDSPTGHAVLLGLMRDVDSFHAARGSRERWALAHGFDEDDRGAWKAYAELGRMAVDLEHVLGGHYGALQRAARLARREADQAFETGAVAAEPVRQHA